jgi:nitroimidazol reductase NimA-like FMN-containing flavoprotein (pyridoxamine 5'-phosphate oxidase superfamily)
MSVREMTDYECRDLLARRHVGHLAAVRGARPYIVPVHYAFEADKLYVFSLPGQKIEFLRSNPNTCVQVEEFATPRLWKSVVVQGTYEELPDTPEQHDKRLHAWSLLQTRQLWWEPGSFKPDQDATAPTLPIFFSITINEISGREILP